MLELISNRLFLRPLNLADAEDFFSYRSDTETNKFQGWVPGSIEDAREFIKNKVATTFNVPNTWFQMVIFLKKNNHLIGDLGIHFIDENNTQSELGCTLNKQYHGNGFAVEAMETVISCLFNKFNKHRIHASVDPKNTNSVKLMENLGFRKEAHFKESLLINNEWVDDVIYALLKSEWSEK